MDIEKSNFITDQLLEAMDIIANKKIENLPFDKTILCTITDDTNKDEGEYEVSFSSSQSKVTHFTAYAQEGAEYNKDDNVYVNVPQNDFSQQKTIIRKYINDQTSPINYINPMERFIKIFPTEEENNALWWWNSANGASSSVEHQDEWSLKANGEKIEELIIEMVFKEYINQFDCLGVSAFFKSLLKEYDPIEGEYGLRFEFIGLKEGWDTADHIEDYYIYKTETFSSDEMYGLVYGYSAYQKQEKLINLQDFPGTISAMRVYFYQNKDFKYYNNGIVDLVPGDTVLQTKEQYTEETDPSNGETIYILNTVTVNKSLPHDLFIKDLTLSFGYLVGNTYDKELRLYTTSSPQYDEKLTDSDNEKTLKLRWIEENSDGLYTTIDEQNDKIPLSWWDNKSIYIYKYTYGKDGVDEYAGPFWERVASWSRYKDSKKAREIKQEDGKYKYVTDQGIATIYMAQRTDPFSIDVPSAGIQTFNNFFEFKVNITNSDKLNEFVRYKVIIVEQNIIASTAPYTTELYYDEEDEGGIPSNAVISGSNYWVVDNTTEQIYESNEITFYNKNETAGKATMALIDGLELKCMDNSNGIYRIYGEDNKISAQINSKTMTLRANFNAIHILGLDSGEANITWYYPKNNTMFVSPLNEGNKQIVIYNKAEESIPDSELLEPSEEKQYYIKIEENYYQIISHTFDGESSATPAYERNGQKYKKSPLQDIYIKGMETVEFQSWSSNKDENYYVLEQPLKITQYGDADRIEPVSNEITYTIDSFYSSTKTNNTIKCKISRYGKDYWAEKEFFFGHQGNNGTNYAFDISLEREYGNGNSPSRDASNSTIVPFLKIVRDQNGNTSANDNPWIKVKPTLIYGQEEITDSTILSKIRWSLYAKTTYDGVASHEPSVLIYNSSNGYYTGSAAFIKLNTNNIGKINPGTGEKTGDSIILKAELVKQVTFKEGNITNEGITSESSTESDVTKSITLTAYLPIAIADFYQENAEHKFNALDISFYEGATSILYNNYGSDPIYYEGEHKLLNSNSQKISGVNWKIFTNDATNIKKINYYPNMVKSKILNNGEYTEVDEWLLKPTSMFFTGLTKEVSIQAILGGRVIYSQPLLILQNAYGNQTINQWDGSLKIDKENNYILSAMLGAGVKNSDNSFSGVLLGKVGTDYSAKTGIYGYGNGVQTYGFRENGTAFIGASGAGRIEFDGNNATITSGNYATGQGMKIDLDDGKIDAYNFTLTAGSKTDELNEQIIITSNNEKDDEDKYKYYPLTIGDKFSVEWDGTLHASNAILGSDTTLEGMALNTNNVALSAYISALKILEENNKTKLSNTYSIYAETQNDVLIQNHAVGDTTTFQTYYVNENTNTNPSTYTWYKKIKTSDADNPFGYTLDSSNSAITFSSGVTYYIIKCSLKTENVTTYNDQGIGSTTSVTGIGEEQAGDFYGYSGTSATGYGSLYGKSYFKKLTDKELQSFNITLVSKNGLLRANNAIISGTIYANAGEIGGWTIKPYELSHNYSSITNGIRVDNNKAFIYFNTDGTGVNISNFGAGSKYYAAGGTGNGSSNTSPLPFPNSNDIANGYLKNIIFSIGKNFAVDQNGNLFANNGNFSGSLKAGSNFEVTSTGVLTAKSGTIGGLTLQDGYMYRAKDANNNTITGVTSTSDGAFCIYPGSGNTINNHTNIVLSIGSHFQVDKSGKLYADSVDLGNTLNDYALSSEIPDVSGFVNGDDVSSIVSTAISGDDTIVFVDTDYSSNNGTIYTGAYYSTQSFTVWTWNDDHTSYSSSSQTANYDIRNNYYIDETTGKVYQSKYDSSASGYRFKEVTSSFNNTAFKVSSKGLLTCANAVVTGTIFASAGNIGGWTIKKQYLTKGYSDLNNNIELKDDYAFLYPEGVNTTGFNEHITVDTTENDTCATFVLLNLSSTQTLGKYGFSFNDGGNLTNDYDTGTHQWTSGTNIKLYNTNRYTASNARNSTWARARIKIRTTKPGTVKIHITQNTELNWDYLIISDIYTTIQDNTLGDNNGTSGAYYSMQGLTEYTFQFEGLEKDTDYYFYIKSIKDSSDYSGADLITISLSFNSEIITKSSLPISDSVFSIGKNFVVDKSGALYSLSGMIGGWNIQADKIYYNNKYYLATPIFDQYDTNPITGSTERGTLRLGDNFFVSDSGILYCLSATLNSANITGTLTSSLIKGPSFELNTGITNSSNHYYGHGLTLNSLDNVREYQWQDTLGTVLIDRRKVYNTTVGGYIEGQYDSNDPVNTLRYAFIRGFGETSYQGANVFLGIMKVKTNYNAIPSTTSDFWTTYVHNSMSDTSGGYVAKINFDGTGSFKNLYVNDQAVTSDRRFKTNITILNNNSVLSFYDNLIPKQFKFKDSENPNYYYGFIAQEVEELLNQYNIINNSLVIFNKEEDAYYLNYNNFHALHVAKNHQQDERIKQLEEEVKILQNEIKELREKGGK